MFRRRQTSMFGVAFEVFSNAPAVHWDILRQDYQQPADANLVGYFPQDLVIRASGSPQLLLPAVRRIIQAADPEQPISNVRPSRRSCKRTRRPARFKCASSAYSPRSRFCSPHSESMDSCPSRFRTVTPKSRSGSRWAPSRGTFCKLCCARASWWRLLEWSLASPWPTPPAAPCRHFLPASLLGRRRHIPCRYRLMLRDDAGGQSGAFAARAPRRSSHSNSR